LVYNTFQWNLLNQSIAKIENQDTRFPLPCNCEAKVIDESPDGNWQIIETQIIEEGGKSSYARWLISQNKQYKLQDARDWSWSTDGSYFSYTWATDGPIGILNILGLEKPELVWSSANSAQETGNIPEGFLIPWPLSHNITFSPTDKTYWYRAWFPEDQNKIYVYDPIAREGRIEHIENIRSAIWSDALNQLLFVKSDDEYITITSENGLVSANIPYELYLEIDGEGLESELTHTNFQVSPQGSYVVFPKNGQMYALGCNEEQ
jgi:hypothetical protein